MRKHQRQHTGGQAYKRKKRQIRHAEDDLRHHNRDHGQIFQRAARLEMAAGQPHRPERTKRRGRRAADQRKLQAVEKRVNERLVVKELSIPGKREARPMEQLCIVKRISDDDRDRQIQQQQNQHDVKPGEP